MHKVAVYGSLKKGFYNNDLLHDAEFIGVWITPAKFTMYDLGPFPAVVTGGTCSIHTEIYTVDDQILEMLDQLEGHPDFYRRRQFKADGDHVYMYVMDQKPGDHVPVISDGKWTEGTQSYADF